MFSKRVTLFKLLGFEVRIDASWIILALLVVWSLAQGFFPAEYPGLPASTYFWMAVLGAAGLFVSIVAHEFAHSLVARRHGIPMKGITLFIFGGVAEMGDEPPNAKAEFRMAIAGPIASVLLAAAFYGAARLVGILGAEAPLRGILGYLSLINALLAGFNLIPAFPLDGGRVLRSFLWSRNNDIRRSTRTAANIGSAFGTALILLGVLQVLAGSFVGGMWWFLIGMFLRGASQMSYRQVEIRRALQGEPVARFMRRDPVTVPPTLSLAELVDGVVYRHYYDVYPVLDNSHLAGCIGLKELKQVPRSEWSQTTVGDSMQICGEGNTISPDTDAVKALSIMSKSGNSRLMVVEDGHLLGVITLKDLLAFLTLKLDLEGTEELDRELARV